jgi:hypothetical protein
MDRKIKSIREPFWEGSLSGDSFCVTVFASGRYLVAAGCRIPDLFRPSN